MQNKIKIYRIALLCLLFLAVGCSKDDYNLQNQNTQNKKSVSYRLTGKDAEAVAIRLNKKLNNSASFNGGMSRVTTAYGTISYDEIMEVIDSLGKINYTFRVDHPESSDTKFFNLVLQEMDGKSLVKLYKYEMTPEFAEIFKRTASLEGYAGKVSSNTIYNETPCPDKDLLDIHIGSLPGTSTGSSGASSGNGTGNPGNSSGTGTGSSGTGSNSSGSSGTGSSGTGDTGGNNPGGNNDSDAWLEIATKCVMDGNGAMMYVDGECIRIPRFFKTNIHYKSDVIIGDDGTPITSNDPCPPIEIGTLAPIDKCTQSFLTGLQYDQPALNYLYNNPEVYEDLMNYIADSGDCEASKSIAQDLLQVLANNGDDPNASDDGIVLDAPPSCQSFNFTPTTSNWQESAVQNIHFIIVLLDHNGLNINHVVDFPNAILFGMPMNIQIGNTNVTSGVAATVSANVLARSVRETVKMYGGKPVSETIVSLYFESRLKHNYQTSIPGGRVNTHPTSYSVTPTQYKSTTSGSDSCM